MLDTCLTNNAIFGFFVVYPVAANRNMLDTDMFPITDIFLYLESDIVW